MEEVRFVVAEVKNEFNDNRGISIRIVVLLSRGRRRVRVGTG